MRQRASSRRARVLSGQARAALFGLALLAGGCTSLRQWVHNGFRVGPNYQPPPAKVTSQWIDSADPHVSSAAVDGSAWWHVLRDPALSSLIDTAFAQNLDLKTAA